MNYQPNTFFEAPKAKKSSKYRFGLFGIPWDANSTHLKGSPRATPSALRSLSYHVSTMTELSQNIFDFNIGDFGDVSILPSKPQMTESNIKQMLEIVFQGYNQPKSVIPVMIGGDHYCTYPVIRNLAQIYEKKDQEDFGVLIFDAHLDYYDAWLGKEENMHCTITKRVANIDNIGPNNTVVFGARDIDTPELDQAQNDGLYFVKMHEIDPKGNYSKIEEKIEGVIEHFHNQGINNLYISIDIDVLDGPTASGTGYAFPGGLLYRHLWFCLKKVVRDFDVVGFDMVEVAPDLDTPSKLTQNTAIKLIVELMSFIYMKQNGINF